MGYTPKETCASSNELTANEFLRTMSDICHSIESCGLCPVNGMCNFTHIVDAPEKQKAIVAICKDWKERHCNFFEQMI